jgi:response regulator of citrate/malate metabolism
MIFLDINMPKMNGWDFLDAYQQVEDKVKVYMLSSSINSKDIQKSETYEVVNGFICKPLVVEKLSEILKEEGMT